MIMNVPAVLTGAGLLLSSVPGCVSISISLSAAKCWTDSQMDHSNGGEEIGLASIIFKWVKT